METPAVEFDVAVVGAGPAGSTLAGLLAGWGRSVALIDENAQRTGVPEETLVPGAAPVLGRCGALAIIRAHGFLGSPRHGIVWSDGELKWRVSEKTEDRGFKVARDVFDRDMRRTAQGLGATLFEDSRIKGPLPDGEGQVVLSRSRDDDVTIQARVFAVATGRSHTGELVSAEIDRSLPSTLALSCLVESDKRTDATIIESVPAGWLWWLPLHEGKVCVTLFADAEEIRERGKSPVFEEALNDSIAAAEGVKCLPERGCVATPRLCRTRSPILLCGSAASTIDPLSSQGLEKAMASAEHAAVALNTILEDSTLTPQVLQHHASWERSVWLAHARDTLQWYLRETRFSDKPFWANRHAAVEVRVEEPHPDGLPATIQKHPDLAERATLRRKGPVFVPTTGWGRDDLDVINHVNRVPLGPLFSILDRTGEVDTIISHAGQDPDLCILSPHLIVQALTELYRMGIIEAYSPNGDQSGG